MTANKGSTQRSPSIFSKFARSVSSIAGQPLAFVTALGMVVAWALAGPALGFSDSWQMVINTTTTILTFLMLFLVQNTQNRDSQAMQLKLDEVIRAIGEAHNEVLDIEDSDHEELVEARKEYELLAQRARSG
jgi:low affinity Fe/Cu permease